MRKLRTLVASVLVIAMMVPAVSVGATQTHLQGTGTVINPVMSVLLPTVPVVTINPLQVGYTTLDPVPQVSSPTYAIVNRSNVPVSITMRAAAATTAAAATQVTFVADPAGINVRPSGTDAAVRNAHLLIEWATGSGTSTITRGNTAAQLSAVGDGAIDWTFPAASATDHSRQPLTAATGIGVAMEGGHVFNIVFSELPTITGTAAEIAAQPVPSTNYAAFRFGGAVNRYATFAANSVVARVVFTVEPVSPVVYALDGAAAPNRFRPLQTARFGAGDVNINNVYSAPPNFAAVPLP